MVKKAGNDAVVASAFHRGYMAAATVLLIAYKAAVGEMDVSKLALEQRHGQYAIGCVTPENAAQFRERVASRRAGLMSSSKIPSRILSAARSSAPRVELRRDGSSGHRKAGHEILPPMNKSYHRWPWRLKNSEARKLTNSI